MDNLRVSYHLNRGNSLIYIEDVLSDNIMNSAPNLLSIKPLYLREKGYKNHEIKNFQVLEEGEATSSET